MIHQFPRREDTHLEHHEVDDVENVYVDSPGTHNANVIRTQESIYLLFGIIEVLIGIRFVLRAFGANPAAPFASTMYTITAPLVAPFTGLFGQPQLSQSVFEPQCAVAIVVYALLGWAIAKLIGLMMTDTRVEARTATRAVHTDHEHEHEHRIDRAA